MRTTRPKRRCLVLGEPLGGGDQTDVVQQRRAQLEAQRGDAAARLGEHLLDVPDPLGAPAGQRVAQRAQLQRSQREQLAGVVVQIRRQRAALPVLGERGRRGGLAQGAREAAQLRDVEQREADRARRAVLPGSARPDELRVQRASIGQHEIELQVATLRAERQHAPLEVPAVLVLRRDEARQLAPDRAASAAFAAAPRR